MKRRVPRLIAAACGLVAVASVARADAPAGQYFPFGVADTYITDDFTQLNWQRASGPTVVGLDAAAQQCAALKLGGFARWRLPSYKELLTLVDENPHDEYPQGSPVLLWIDGHAFPGTWNGPYWSSSTTSGGKAFVVSFGDGTAKQAPAATTTAAVRCVTP